jgi:DNA polymerase-3 subunit epsilon
MTRGRASWRDTRFIVVDLETTGLDPRHDEVIAFAAVPIDDGRIRPAATVTGFVRPAMPPPPQTIEIHGLRPQDVAGAPPADRALGALAAALRGRIPVAHAAWIERAFLTRARRHGVRLARRPLDTADLWRLLCLVRGLPDPGFVPLGELAELLGLPVHRRHEADGDALTTAQLFLSLATHLEGAGLGSVNALTGARRRVEGQRLLGTAPFDALDPAPGPGSRPARR